MGEVRSKDDRKGGWQRDKERGGERMRNDWRGGRGERK